MHFIYFWESLINVKTLINIAAIVVAFLRRGWYLKQSNKQRHTKTHALNTSCTCTNMHISTNPSPPPPTHTPVV